MGPSGLACEANILDFYVEKLAPFIYQLWLWGHVDKNLPEPEVKEGFSFGSPSPSMVLFILCLILVKLGLAPDSAAFLTWSPFPGDL